MHPRQSTILSACLGFTATLGARMWLPDHEVRPTVRPLVVAHAAEVPAPMDPCPATAEGLREKRDALSGELSRLQLEQEMVRIQTGTALGFPQTWEGRLPFEAPDAFRERLEAALARQEGAELLAMDCEEYPCLPLITGADIPRVDREMYLPYDDSDVPHAHAWWSTLPLSSGEERRYGSILVAYDISAHGPDLSKRLKTRLERLRRAWQPRQEEVIR